MIIHKLIDLDILTPVCLLSSYELLKRYQEGNFTSISDIRETLFIAQRKLRYDLPDHIHNNLIEDFFTLETNNQFFDLIINAVHRISEKFFNKEGYIKNELYVNWCNLLTILPPTIFRSYNSFLYNIKELDSCSSLPIPLENKLMTLTANRLIETHIHINGTSEVIFSWHDMLSNLNDTYITLKNSFKSNHITFEQNNIKDINSLISTYEHSSYIFKYIYYSVDFKKTHYKKWNSHLNINSKYDLKTIIDAKVMATSKSNKHGKKVIYNEIKLYKKIFEIFDQDSSTEVCKNTYARLIHFYILSQALHNTFFVQQLNQYGFDQFQRITDNKLRDTYEDKGFIDRFQQLEGVNGCNKLKHLELRFAPKSSSYKIGKLYSKIIKNYQKYYRAKTHRKPIPSLSLTSHFIKLKEEHNPRYVYIRDGLTRNDLEKKSFALKSLLSSYHFKHLKKLKEYSEINYIEYFNSIDAAGNELFARPEAFASTFNNIKVFCNKYLDKNIKTTFHAGEDFIHIVSGIRYVFEAVTFLNLQSKDRIGHATALGLTPQRWKSSIGNSIIIKQGEYLENLFFIYMMLNKEEKYNINLKSIKKLFNSYCQKVYDSIYSFNTYRAFFLNKHLGSKEAKIKLNSKAYELYLKYNSLTYFKNFNKLSPLDLNEIPDNVITYLQNKVLSLLKFKNIAIETMITSNTRISFYNNYKEHHILNWLQNPNAPDIILASDDPGIFNNNLYLEYFILYKILEDTELCKDAIIDKIIRDTEKYCFKSFS